ncbi:RNA polymerase sigma factor [Stenotrophomonas sp. ISL-67]|uniref:RNA polymerase sigma factor n=1 Tax=Stenotrophomonas sp. ISL-67 TaxID=2819171 RepID=UPI001BEBC2A7|nr:RNA polymerase sigma factor [Stenotrophomonas sp. ISL-67]MBT2766326.1 RNA polymerase sigma factor [Stenotrophomonas sp. ISL-67]
MTALPLTDTLDRELPAAAGGCQQSYGRIVLACQNTVTAIALAITRDVQASEDIAQEAFIKGWQQLNQLHSHASFLPWLRQITRNLARDWLRANRGRPLSGDAAEIAISMAADPSPSAPEYLQRAEEELAAEEIISALPEDGRETLLLYYREGQSSQQVANLLGLSDAAVRKRLSRARASVRGEMLRRFGEFARGSAPSAAFATAVVSMVMVAAPGTASAAILLGTSVGVGSSKIGLGGASLSGGAAMGSLGAAATQSHLLTPGVGWTVAIAGIIGGVVGSYLGGRYLLCYTETPAERAAVHRFVHYSTFTAMLVCMTVLALTLLQAPPYWALIAMVLGTGLVNYQCLVPLQRIMAPMIARDAARHGRSGPNWKYQSMYGRPALVVTNLAVIGVVIAMARARGMF